MRTVLVSWLLVSSCAIVFAGQTAQDDSGRRPLRAGSDVPMPRKIRDVPPIYPNVAQAARAQGVIVMEVLVDLNGKVVSAKVLKSIPLLDQAAIDAVKQWEFEPTRVDGTAVPVIVTTTVNFSLDGAKDAPAVPGSDPSTAAAAPRVPATSAEPRATPTGLKDALKNLQEYIRREELRHPQAQAGATIELEGDTAEFGPWLRRFVGQVKGNWVVPETSTEIGRSVVRFAVQRDGAIKDVKVATSSKVVAYDLASRQAIVRSSPAQPLPTEYKGDRIWINVTFHYNEPGAQETIAPVVPAGTPPPQ